MFERKASFIHTAGGVEMASLTQGRSSIPLQDLRAGAGGPPLPPANSQTPLERSALPGRGAGPAAVSEDQLERWGVRFGCGRYLRLTTR